MTLISGGYKPPVPLCPPPCPNKTLSYGSLPTLYSCLLASCCSAGTKWLPRCWTIPCDTTTARQSKLCCCCHATTWLLQCVKLPGNTTTVTQVYYDCMCHNMEWMLLQVMAPFRSTRAWLTSHGQRPRKCSSPSPRPSGGTGVLDPSAQASRHPVYWHLYHHERHSTQLHDDCSPCVQSLVAKSLDTWAIV